MPKQLHAPLQSSGGHTATSAAATSGPGIRPAAIARSRRLIVQAVDAAKPGAPGTASRPPPPPVPQLQPLPQRPNMAPAMPARPPLPPAAPAGGPNGPARPTAIPAPTPPGAGAPGQLQRPPPPAPPAQPQQQQPLQRPTPVAAPTPPPPQQQQLQPPPQQQQPLPPQRPAPGAVPASMATPPTQGVGLNRPAAAPGAAMPPPLAKPGQLQPPTGGLQQPPRAAQPQLQQPLQRPPPPPPQQVPPMAQPTAMPPLQRPVPPPAAAAAGPAAGGPGLLAKPGLPPRPPPPAGAGAGAAAGPLQQQPLQRPPMQPPSSNMPMSRPAGGAPMPAPSMPAMRPPAPSMQRPAPGPRPSAGLVTLDPIRPPPQQVQLPGGQQQQPPQQMGAPGGFGGGPGAGAGGMAPRVDISLNRVPANTSATSGAGAMLAEQELEMQQERGRRRPTRRVGGVEVIEEDEDAEADEDEEGEGKGKGKGKKGKKGRREKVTAEMKRTARKMREAEREEKAAANRRDKEEIFEVGEEGMSLEALAEAIQVDPSDIVRSLFMKGIMLSLNQVLDRNTVKLVGSEYDLLVVDKESVDVTDAAKKQREFLELEDIEEAVPRPPVVTVMGHVDHGKTSLLDFIRKAKVAAGEAGGITQAIGAYNVEVDVDGTPKTICFLDTPGHEAFSAMRARGARVTDIAIIIVAADDGVQPQTREAVSHAQAAGVPIVVAINKVDKPGADVERAKQGLLELNLVPEEWGGSTPMVPVSAKKGTGIDDLLQNVLWVAEEKQLMANPARLAAGTVIEAHLDRKIGPVATLLVQAGTLRVGDVVSAGACAGKVRTLSNAAGAAITSAGPSIAVQLVGLNAVPQAGDEFQAHATDAEARTAASAASEGLRAARMAEMSASGSMVTLSSLATLDEEVDSLQRMNLIIKGDTSGVVEAIKGALQSLPQESVVLRYLLCAAGDIHTSDVDLAAASGGLIVGFNLNPDEGVLAHAKQMGVTINTYKVIYNLIDDVKAAMEGKLRAVEEKQDLGQATVKAVFGTGKKRVAGVVVDSGRLAKGATVEVVRGSGKDKAVVVTGKLTSLRRIKDNVDEVQAGLECGVGLDNFTAFQEGDVLNCYQVVSKVQRLEDARAATAVDLATLGA